MKKTNRDIRIKAYTLLQELSKQNIEQEKLLKEVKNKFLIPYGTLYDWYKYNHSPYGKRRIQYNSDLFYVLGALLGDGCAYYWKKADMYMVIITGEKELIEKYSNKLEKCIGKKIKGYLDRNKKIWNLKILNIELYQLLNKIRENREILIKIIKEGDYNKNSLQFIEGYFDAEGCVKIIKEDTRKIPKICLDICSTDYSTLEIIRKSLNEHLSIIAKYSIQEAYIGKDGSPRKKSYHLRIYKKDYIRKFFNNFNTIKLKPEKIRYVANWLNNGK